jgi:hypothetical protein
MRRVVAAAVHDPGRAVAANSGELSREAHGLHDLLEVLSALWAVQKTTRGARRVVAAAVHDPGRGVDEAVVVHVHAVVDPLAEAVLDCGLMGSTHRTAEGAGVKQPGCAKQNTSETGVSGHCGIGNSSSGVWEQDAEQNIFTQGRLRPI